MRSSREHGRFVSFGALAVVRSVVDDGKLVSVFLSYNSHKSLQSIMGERDAQLHATFSPKFSSFPRSHNATIFFSGRNINSLSLCSPRFCPPCAKSCKDVANGSFPPPFYQLHAQRASRNLFPLRGKRKVVEKKREEDPPNRGILDQRRAPEGNHIFRTETTVSPFFSAIFLVPPLPPLLPPLPISRYFPVSQFEREISSNVQTCFCGDFLAARFRDGGSDCRQDPTRDW